MLENFLDAKTEFVFGKYRHHIYNIEKLVRSESGFYRGGNYADMLFKYERSIAAATIHAGEKIWQEIRKRYESQEKHIPEELRMLPD